MPKISVNGIQLYYESHGQGYPVVFLHGFSATHLMWNPQVDAFSQKYRFVIYDARGHGQTDSPPDVKDYSEEIVTEDLYRLLQALGIQKAVIGGLSMGGYESLLFYKAHPDLVSALVLMDTGPGYRNPARRDEWNRGREALAKRLETEGIEVLAANAPTETGREIMLKQSPVGLAHMSRKVVAQRDSRVIDSLSQIKAPTLVLVGSEDRPFHAAADYMVKTIPGAEKAVIPQAGHASNIDQPEAFNAAVLGFLGRLNPA